MDPDVAVRHVILDLWNCAAKPCKNGKVSLYDTALAIEHIQAFSAQGSTLAIIVAICVAALVRIIQVVSRSNILILVGLLGGRFRVLIPIFAIVLLWRGKQDRILEIV